GILHSFMESHIDGVVLLATDFVQKDEKKDERVDRILDMINSKHDWNNHVWGVKEATNSEFEESGEDKGEDQTADTERGENSHVAGNVDGTADVSGRNKRKHADRGAESRKKNILCHLAASSKGNIDTDMKNFLEDLVQASFTTFGKKFCQQFSDRLGKIETEVTQLRTASERTEQFETAVTDRLGKIEAEVTQLRTTLVMTELVGNSDQASSPSITKINSGPSTSKKGTAPSKKKLKTADSCVNLPRAKVTQSSASDLRMGTQEFLESCMKNLPLDGTQQQQFAWTADTLVKLSTMMQTVWGALAKIRCPPTPSCYRAPKTSEAAGITRDDAVNEPSDEATDEKRGSRLHRSRRAPGESRSCSPDDHQ
ncbi:hypothetical protein IGI04_003480, partial [Brassica rapa subsp. trilocularis]